MLTEQADALARRIVNLWRSTPKLVEWVNKLESLDHELAERTIDLLRDEHAGGSMPIAQFSQKYRELSAPPLRVGAPGRCELCDGTGFRHDRIRYLVIGTDDEIDAGHGRVCEYPQPCMCRLGDDATRNAPTMHIDVPHRWMTHRPPHWWDIEHARRAAALADPQTEEHADA